MRKLIPFLIIFWAANAFAQTDEKTTEKSDFIWHLNTRLQYLSEENRDLGTRNEDRSGNFTFDTRLIGKYRPSGGFLAYFEGGAVQTVGDGMAPEDETGAPRPSSGFFELRQLYIRFDKLISDLPLQFQLGRQRIREDYALWWNRDLDAARVLYAGDKFKGFIGVAKDLAYYRTDDERGEERGKALHILGETSFVLTPQDNLEFRGLYEDDDNTDSKRGWAGFRFAGVQSALHGLKYRLDTIGMTGTDENHVSGWALDAGAELPLGEKLPSLIIGYAYGSRDFRQSKIYGNSSRVSGSSTSINNYGEAFRPELANLHILTAGISIPVMNASDLSFLYHYYRMADESADLGDTHVTASPAGTDKDLGQELDAIFNVKLNDELENPAFPDLEKNIRISTGIFRAGDAFASAGDEISYRALAEFRLRY